MLRQLIDAMGSLWNLAVVLGVVVVLAGFVYAIFLKRLLRARRIAHMRERRLLREAAERR